MPVPYYLNPKATKLPEGPDDSLEPAVEPVDAETRSLVPFDWAQFDKSKGGTGPPDAPLSPPATDPALRSLPPFDWPSGYVPGRALRELVSPIGDLDPDIALWGVTTLQRWPFTGHPTVGIWPLGWVGVDNTATGWVCIAGGQPGTWEAIFGPGVPPVSTGFPIANPAGSVDHVTTPDPIVNSGTQTWVQFPHNQSAIGWGLTGDTYPRIMYGSDPKKGFLFVGPGTYDPTQNTNMMALLNDVDRGDMLQITSNGVNSGVIIGALSAMGSGLGNPNTSIGGIVGDIMSGVFNGGTGFSYSSWWRCITGGSPSTPAVWALVLIVAATDPISTSFVAANAGALWQDTSGSGSLWMSTGTSAGDWSLIGGDTGWINLTLVNSWSVVTSARYRKKNGVVYLDVGITGGSTQQFSTLPAGFRPLALVNGEFPAPVINSGTTTIGLLEVNSSGSLFAANLDASTPGTVNGYFSFIADQ